MMEKPLNGSLQVLAAIYTLMIFMSFLVSSKSFFVFADPPASGDWVIIGTETYYDQVIVLNGSLIIQAGGNMTFRRITLKMNCTYSRQYNITVMPGGQFYVLEDSAITATDPEKRIGFLKIQYGSTFRMDDSQLHDCGEGPMLSGLMIDSSDAIVENNLFSRNTWGILVSKDGVIIRSNNITENTCGIEVLAGANPIIYDNYISQNDVGMTTGQGSPTIYNNTITQNGRGIDVEGGSPTIYNNTITSNLGGGINGVFNIGSTITDNLITENSGVGISCNRYSSPTIANNTITSTIGDGVWCRNHSDATIQGNIIKNNTRGIYCHENSNPTIEGNNITSNGEQGIWVMDSNPTIRNNTISLNNGTGITVDRGSSTVYNNTIDSNSEQGIILYNGADPIIRENVIHLNGYAGIHGDNNCSPIIQSNYITSNFKQGIVMMNKSSPTIQGNTIVLNHCDGIVIASNCSLVIESNNVTSNGVTGVAVHHHCTGIIQGNIITSNMDVGIHCADGSLPEIHWNDVYDNAVGMVDLENDDPSVTVNATYNFWGNEPSISSYVLYDPWLTESVFTPKIATPLSGEMVSSTVTISTNIDARSGVQKVEFYIDDELAYTDCNMSYEWIWNTTQYTETEHKITVQAHYMFGFISTSVAVFVDNTPPLAKINTPTNGTHVKDFINVNVTCTDNNINRMELYINSILKQMWKGNGTRLYDWNTSAYTDGSYTLELMVYDEADHWTTATTTVTVDNTLPTAEIRKPTGSTRIKGSYEVTVYAYDDHLDTIELYANESLITSWKTHGIHIHTWNTTDDGTYKIRLLVKDKVGNSCTDEIWVIVDNTPPTVLIEEPISGDICYGMISVCVNATDNNEIDDVHVEIGDTGLSAMTFNGTDFLWKYQLNTTTYSDGQYTLMVLALDETGNPTTTSITICIDNTPPTLAIQTPEKGMTVALTLIVNVQASDVSGISRIEFYLQDLLVHTATEKPYKWSWDTTEHPNGEYNITVKAYDMIGRTKTSETTVTIQNMEPAWWQSNFWTIIQVLIAIGGLLLGILAYITRKKQEKKESSDAEEAHSQSLRKKAEETEKMKDKDSS